LKVIQEFSEQERPGFSDMMSPHSAKPEDCSWKKIK